MVGQSQRRKSSEESANFQVSVLSAKLPRPAEGLRWNPKDPPKNLPVEGKPAWQGNGGPFRDHPARSLPFSFDAAIPEKEGDLRRISLVGILALYASRENTAPGAVGATVQLLSGGEIVFRVDLLNGRQYRDAVDLTPWPSSANELVEVKTVGTVNVSGQACRVDRLTIDLPESLIVDTLRFKDLGTAASFVFFDVFYEFETAAGCPFKASSGGIALGDLAAIVRVGDRVRFNRALEQLTTAIEAASDLDEARGQALTFLAVVTAGTLEMGGSREMHRVQLEAARHLDKVHTIEDICQVTRETVSRVSGPLFGPKMGPSARLVDRALNLVERNYAKDLSDASVAEQLGLSTSHFRFLFKQATGQPFHKYLVAVRLEKARKLLVDESMPVSAIAASVGFSGLAHFSRAFSQRFQVSPTTIRRSAGDADE